MNQDRSLTNQPSEQMEAAWNDANKRGHLMTAWKKHYRGGYFSLCANEYCVFRLRADDEGYIVNEY